MKLRAPSLIACLIACLVSISTPAHAAVPAVVGTGILEYSIIKDGALGTCAGEGPFVVSYDDATRRLSVAGSAVSCMPMFAVISDCDRVADGSVVCDKRVEKETITVTLGPEGRFAYVWHAPDFHEEIHGIIERIA